jgi:4-amino-4-deoxy-L-arabinose transferase-like glycosyltransferase
LLFAAVILSVSCIFLFARLGHYALWDDEANTALIAKGVWKTGDTTVIIDHNVVLYRNGWTLKNLHERATPPLSFYLAAPFIGIFGESSFAARLPFALCGLGCVVLMLYWLWRAQAGLLTGLLAGLGLLGNVSFFLFCRQARYYSLAMLLAMLLVYLYLHRERRWKLIAFALISVALLATQYILFAALYACLAVDFFTWGRKERPLSWQDWAVLLVPQLIFGGLIVLIWNPFTTAVAADTLGNTALQKLTLFWWNLRDLSRAEFGIGLLLIACPIIALVARRSAQHRLGASYETWLLRGWLPLLIYAAVISVISVQPVARTSVADIRYLTPLIPLCIILATLCLRIISGGKLWIAVPLALIAFGTNLFNGSWLPHFGPTRDSMHSTPVRFIEELRSPPTDPYAVAAARVNQNTKPYETVFVWPDYMTYPLMYHAPRATYAWQIKSPGRDPQLQNLAPIHYFGQGAPDLVILFGLHDPAIMDALRSAAGGKDYTLVDRLNCFWVPLQRPELFFHSFTPITDFNTNSEAIFVFRRPNL